LVVAVVVLEIVLSASDQLQKLPPQSAFRMESLPTPHSAKLFASCFSWPRDPATESTDVSLLIYHKDTQWKVLTILPTRIHPRAAIHSEPQAHRMQRIAHSLHPARELRAVGHQRPVGVAPGGPAVVEDDVVVAEVAEAIVDDLLGGGEEEVLADVAAEGVPVILAGEVSLR